MENFFKPERHTERKKAFLSYEYQPKFSRKIRKKKGAVYFYLLNNIPHQIETHEHQFLKFYDYWELQEQAYQTAKIMVQSLPLSLVKDVTEDVKNFIEWGVFFKCLRYEYLESIKQQIVSMGYSQVTVIDSQHRESALLFENRYQTFPATLIRYFVWWGIFNGRALMKSILARRKPCDFSLNYILSIYDRKQDYENLIDLMGQLDSYGLWLSENRRVAKTPEIRSLTIPVFFTTALTFTSILKLGAYSSKLLFFNLFQKNIPAVYFFQDVLRAKYYFYSYLDSLKKYPHLKAIIGSFEAKRESFLLYKAADMLGVKLINMHHACVGNRWVGWRYYRFHYDILPGEYWKEAAQRNHTPNKVLGLYTMEHIRFQRSDTLSALKEEYKICLLIGPYHNDVPTLESGLNSLEILKYTKKIFEKKKDWLLIIRPRFSDEQYHLFVNEIFHDFSKERIIIDVAHKGEFALEQVLSYADMCITASSSAVFEAIKLNVPTVQMHFELSEPHYPILAKHGLTYEVTHANKEEFRDIFWKDEEVILQKKPHLNNWTYYLEHDEDMSFTQKLIQFLQTIS